jgi:hypothetical protein
VIYNRRRNICGFCGAELPPELLFTPAEIELMDKEEAIIAEFRKQQKTEQEIEDLKDECRRQEAQGKLGAFLFGYMIGKS